MSMGTHYLVARCNISSLFLFGLEGLLIEFSKFYSTMYIRKKHRSSICIKDHFLNFCVLF
jgi:hypothetical protein